MPEGAISQTIGVSTGPLPASRKIHVAGKRHPELMVAMREIDLSPACEGAAGARLRSLGPLHRSGGRRSISRLGLAPLREPWIRARGDVEADARRAPCGPRITALRPGEVSEVPLFDRAAGGRCRPRRAVR